MELSSRWRATQLRKEATGETVRGTLSRLLLDAVFGHRAHFVRGDELEAAWAIVDPVNEAVERGDVAMATYALGGDGPEEANALASRVGGGADAVRPARLRGGAVGRGLGEAGEVGAVARGCSRGPRDEYRSDDVVSLAVKIEKKKHHAPARPRAQATSRSVHHSSSRAMLRAFSRRAAGALLRPTRDIARLRAFASARVAREGEGEGRRDGPTTRGGGRDARGGRRGGGAW